MTAKNMYIYTRIQSIDIISACAMNLKMSKSHKKIKINYRNFIENQSDIYVMEQMLQKFY